MSLEVDGVWKTGVWATTVWADGVWREGEAPPAPVVEEVVRSKGGRRYRIIEDPDKLVEELEREEKVVAKQKKELKFLIKKSSSPSLDGALYQQIQEKVEKLEAKIDQRETRITELYILISQRIDEINQDDEEVLLLS